MMISGRLYTSPPVGWYWMSCIRSFWYTTLPGVVATFLPSLNALSSVIEMRSSPLPFSMSESRLFSPRTRFWPPLFSVSRSTCGLVMRKFVSDSASTYWRVKIHERLGDAHFVAHRGGHALRLLPGEFAEDLRGALGDRLADPAQFFGLIRLIHAVA